MPHPRPHDSLFRFTFGDPEHAGPLLRALLPGPVAAEIHWPSLAAAPDDLVDERQREQRADRLFTVQLAGEEAFLYLLLEHKSRPDRWTAVQVLAFLAGLWNQLRNRRPRPRALPPVLPVVVHFGRYRWKASTDIGSLLALDHLSSAARAAILEQLPRFAFTPHDFAQRTPAEVRAMMLSPSSK